MPAYKNKDNGSWYVVTQYTDWTGERKPKCKRGFATRREALEWEQKFQQQSAGDLDMSFDAFTVVESLSATPSCKDAGTPPSRARRHRLPQKPHPPRRAHGIFAAEVLKVS